MVFQKRKIGTPWLLLAILSTSVEPVWAVSKVNDGQSPCPIALTELASIRPVSSEQYAQMVSEAFRNDWGETFDFSGIRFRVYRPSPKPQVVRSPSQMIPEDAALIGKILKRSTSRSSIQGGLENRSIREYWRQFPTAAHEEMIVEYGAFQFHLVDGRVVTGFVSSSDKFQIVGPHLAKALNGLLRRNRLSFSDIAKIRYFHVHPEPLPLSDGDDDMARSILANSPRVKIEMNAIAKVGGTVVVFSSFY